MNNAHELAEARRRRLTAEVNLIVLAEAVREDPLNKGINHLFEEAVKIGFAEGLTTSLMATLTRWSPNAIRGVLGHE